MLKTNVKTLKVKVETHARLKKRGHKEETYGEIIDRLLDLADHVEARARGGNKNSG